MAADRKCQFKYSEDLRQKVKGKTNGMLGYMKENNKLWCTV